MPFPCIQNGVPALVLAPMEGVTDAPMRAMLTASGAFTFCVSEFLRVSHQVPPTKVYLRHVPELEIGALTPAGTPVALQLLGGDPELLAQAALRAVEAGAPAVDLNFGCPAKTVNRRDGGATLLQYPQRIEAIVRAVRVAVPAGIPVSAKLRLGWDSRDPVHRNSEAAARGGADWLTIHARTKAQGYAPPVYWGPLGEVRRRLGLPVVANGDIWNREDLLRCRDLTQCEHFMIGRSAVADPRFPVEAARALGLTAREVVGDWRAMLREFHERCALESAKEGYAARRIKQWLGQADRRGRFKVFESVKRLNSAAEIFRALDALSPTACTL